MQQVEIMFNNILELLINIVDNPLNENFSSALGDKEDDFLKIIFELSNQIEEIKRLKEQKKLFGNYKAIEELIENLQVFEGYTVNRYEELQLIFVVSKNMSNLIGDLEDTNEIDVDILELVSVKNINIELKSYGFENSVSFVDSILFFTKDEYKDFEKYINKKAFSLQFLFILLSKIGLKDNVFNENKYVLLKPGNSNFPNSIIAFLSLHMLSEGLEIHNPKNYFNPPNNPFREIIKVENKYQQFQETFNVINEYNSINDILSKYLKLYQVIEDYMYKSQLAQLENDNAGKLFTLRDFKRMNEEVSGRELNVLEKFIEKVLGSNYLHTTFRQYFLTEWQNQINNYNSQQEIDDVIKLFRIKTSSGSLYKHNTVSAANIHKVLSHLIYNIRNSIVHNKTTEFHLTYFTLSIEIYKFLEKFLIPTAETIIFFLTCEKSSEIVWFKNSSLKLWEEN